MHSRVLKYRLRILPALLIVSIFSACSLHASSNIKVFSVNTEGESFYSTRLQDEKAVYLTPENFHVTPGKEGDDTGALQAAID